VSSQRWAWPRPTGNGWAPLVATPPFGDPLLDVVDLRGAHDFRHTFATWLDDAGIPARVIDELMGHEATTRGAQHLGSTMGAHYRHTTPEMATRVVMAIQDRLAVVVSVAEQLTESAGPSALFTHSHPARAPKRWGTSSWGGFTTCPAHREEPPATEGAGSGGRGNILFFSQCRISRSIPHHRSGGVDRSVSRSSAR
jgi:hypothetical protein